MKSSGHWGLVWNTENGDGCRKSREETPDSEIPDGRNQAERVPGGW